MRHPITNKILTNAQQVRVLKVIQERFDREVTVGMSRSEFRAICNDIARELYS